MEQNFLQFRTFGIRFRKVSAKPNVVPFPFLFEIPCPCSTNLETPILAVQICLGDMDLVRRPAYIVFVQYHLCDCRSKYSSDRPCKLFRHSFQFRRTCSIKYLKIFVSRLCGRLKSTEPAEENCACAATKFATF